MRPLLPFDRRAVAVVEFALVAPVLILVIAAVIVFGMYFGLQIAVTEAASQGARLSVAGLTSAERQQLAEQGACNLLSGYAPLINLNCASGSLATTMASYVSFPSTGNAALFAVTVTYPFTNALPGLISLAGNPTSTITVSIGAQ